MTDKVKVEITQGFDYRGATFEPGVSYEVDPDLVPGWVDHWIVSRGHGVVLPPDDSREVLPDPRETTASGDETPTSPEGAKSPDATTGGPSVEEDDGEEGFSRRPRLERATSEPVKVTSSTSGGGTALLPPDEAPTAKKKK